MRRCLSSLTILVSGAFRLFSNIQSYLKPQRRKREREVIKVVV